MNKIASALEGVDSGIGTGIQLGAMGDERRRADARELRAEKAQIENRVLGLAQVGQYNAATSLAEESNMPYLISQIEGMRDTKLSGLVSEAGSASFDPKANITRGGRIDFSDPNSMRTGLDTARSELSGIENLKTQTAPFKSTTTPPAPTTEPTPTTQGKPISFDNPPTLTSPTTDVKLPEASPPVEQPLSFYEQTILDADASIAEANIKIPQIDASINVYSKIIEANRQGGIKGAEPLLNEYKTLLLNGGLDEEEINRIDGNIRSDLQIVNDNAFKEYMRSPEIMSNPDAIAALITRYNPSPSILAIYRPAYEARQKTTADKKFLDAERWLINKVELAGIIGDLSLVESDFAEGSIPDFVVKAAPVEMINKYKKQATETAVEKEQKDYNNVLGKVSALWSNDIKTFASAKLEGVDLKDLTKTLQFPAYARSLGVNIYISDDPTKWPESLKNTVVNLASKRDENLGFRAQMQQDSNEVAVDEAVDKIIDLGTGRITRTRGGKIIPAKPKEVIKILNELDEYGAGFTPIVDSMTPEGEDTKTRAYLQGVNLRGEIYQGLLDRGYMILPSGKIYNINNPDEVEKADKELMDFYANSKNPQQEAKEYKQSVEAEAADATKAKIQPNLSMTDPTEYAEKQFGKVARAVTKVPSFLDEVLVQGPIREADKKAAEFGRRFR